MPERVSNNKMVGKRGRLWLAAVAPLMEGSVMSQPSMVSCRPARISCGHTPYDASRGGHSGGTSRALTGIAEPSQVLAGIVAAPLQLACADCRLLSVWGRRKPGGQDKHQRPWIRVRSCYIQIYHITLIFMYMAPEFPFGCMFTVKFAR